MSSFPASLKKLIHEFSKLPSIGEKSAGRIAYYLLCAGPERTGALADALVAASARTKFCKECFFLTEDTCCSICSDRHRSKETICVVEKPIDVVAIEKSGSFRGMYHVLHGAWSPIKGVHPADTRIVELIKRIGTSHSGAAGEVPIKEIILATSTTVEGDATALYIARAASELGVKVSRIAQGIPKGGEVEFADELTLHMSIEGRRVL